MKRLLRIGATTALLAFAGCGGITYAYYDLAPAMPTPATAQPVDAVVYVQPLQVAVTYNARKLVYRVSPYEVKYDVESNWVAKPGLVFQDALYRSMSASGRFRTVTMTVSPAADYRLDGYIEVLEEDQSTAPPKARLRVNLSLSTARTGETVWRGQMTGATTLAEGGAHATVGALSRLFEAEIARLLPAMAASIPPPSD